MKSYTDIEQSKELAKILPIETADMGWNVFVDNSTRCLPIYDWDLTKNGEGSVEFIPCWSLAALLELLPKYIEKDGQLTFLDIYATHNYGWVIEYSNNIEDFVEYSFNGHILIDVCYEMIVNLKEQKLL